MLDRIVRKNLWLRARALAFLVTMLAACAGASPVELSRLTSGAPLHGMWSVVVLPRAQTVNDVVSASTPEMWQASPSRPVTLAPDQALWVRLPLDPNGALAPARWFVEFPTPGLDRVEMFRFEDDELTLNEVSGDELSVAVWPVSGRYPAFELMATHWTPATYYFKITNKGPISLAGILKSSSHFTRTQLLSNLFFGTFFGSIALLVVLALEALLTTRHPAYGAYVLYAVCTALACMSSSGLLAEWWIEGNPQLLDSAPFVLAMLTAAAGLLYLSAAVALRELSRARFAATLALAAGGVVLSATSGWMGNAMAPIAISYVTVCVIMGLALLAYAYLKGALWVRSHAASMIPYALALSYPLAEWVFQARLPAHLFFFIAITVVLHLAMSYAALNARMKKLLEASARMQASSTVDPLTGVANYRRLSLQMPGLLERARYNRHQGALLVVEITNLALFRSTSGQRGIEFALVRTAAAIRSAIKNVDMVSRVDDAHFAVAIEGPITGEQASSLAAHMIANGLRTSGKGMNQMPIALRIYIELVPRRSLDLEQMLGAAVHRLRSVAAEDPRRIFLPLD